jgi:dipeptide transport system substrate-binding protein
VFNRLVEFERGTTKIGPALAESWSVSDDGLEYTFKPAQGVKWQTTKDFTPSRDFNADDVVYSFKRQWDRSIPITRSPAAPTSTSTACPCPS